MRTRLIWLVLASLVLLTAAAVFATGYSAATRP